MTTRRTQLLLAAMAFCALLAACGSDTAAVEVAQEVESATAESAPPSSDDTTSTTEAEPDATTTTTTVVDAAPLASDEDVAVLRDFLDAFLANEPAVMAALFTEEYAAEPLPFGGGFNAASWFTWQASYDYDVEGTPTCSPTEEAIVCSAMVQDVLARTAGYEFDVQISARVEDGAITEIFYMSTDEPVFVGLLGWLEESYAGQNECGSGSTVFGSLSEEEVAASFVPIILDTDSDEPAARWMTNCREMMIANVAEFAASPEAPPLPQR